MGRTLTCVGPHDPAVLHYANCGFAYWRRKYEVLGDIPNEEDRKTIEGFEKHRQGRGDDEEIEGFSLHRAARDLVVRGVGGDANAAALELAYRTFVMGDTHGEAAYMADSGLLVRVRGFAALLRRLRAAAQRVRKARGPAVPPPPLVVTPDRWLREYPLKDAPYRRRVRQWRVIFASKVVSRARPSVKAPVTGVFEPGDLVWSGEPRADGWLPLSDDPHLTFLLIDATPLGLGRLLEAVEPPTLEACACEACRAAPCYCEVLRAYGC